MKLLYVWIERFRNIQRQGFVIDNEYDISVTASEDGVCKCYSDNGKTVYGTDHYGTRKVFYCKLSFTKNADYHGHDKDSAIQSIAALVGENASGKSSILECIYRCVDQSSIANKECRYFFMVFLDTVRRAIVVRSRDVWLTGAEDKRIDLRNSAGYEEYVFPLSTIEKVGVAHTPEMPWLISIYQNHREETPYSHNVMGIPTLPINIALKNFRNSFTGIFDFLRDFPWLGADGNCIVFYLRDKSSSREREEYFRKPGLEPDEYKDFFLRKMSELLFGTLKEYLYNEDRPVMADGSFLKRPEDETLRKEYRACSEILSFCTTEYPHSNSGPMMIKTIWGTPIEENISEAIDFFRKSTFVHMGKAFYDDYIDSIERLFSCLYNVDTSYFTDLYKVSIPIDESFRHVVKAFYDCIACGDAGEHWADGIVADFEWFSAGQQQMAIMFSGLYQRLKEECSSKDERNLIVLLDEPETHMHPEICRCFVGILDDTIKHFQTVGFVRGCQIVMATHSPFIIQCLSDYPSSIALTENDRGQITIKDFQNLQKLHLPKMQVYSFNLIMYHVFHVPTVELHDELYGYLQAESNCWYENNFDNWLLEKNKEIRKTKFWIPMKNGQVLQKKNVTLQQYVRNSIHHPENDKNPTYTQAELQQSIEQMLDIVEHLPL